MAFQRLRRAPQANLSLNPQLQSSAFETKLHQAPGFSSSWAEQAANLVKNQPAQVHFDLRHIPVLPNQPPIQSATQEPISRTLSQASGTIDTIQRKVTAQDLIDRGLLAPWKNAVALLTSAKHVGGKTALETEKARIQAYWKEELATADEAEKQMRAWIAEVDLMAQYDAKASWIETVLSNPITQFDKSAADQQKYFRDKWPETQGLAWDDVKKGLRGERSEFGKYLDRVQSLADRQSKIVDPAAEARRKHQETVESPDWLYTNTTTGIIELLKAGKISKGVILDQFPTIHDDSTLGEYSIKVSITNMKQYVIHAHMKADGTVNENPAKGKSPVHIKKTTGTTIEGGSFVQSIPKAYWSSFI